MRREIGRETREEGEILNREFMSGWEGWGRREIY